jgi:hypothetical protein
MQYNNGGTATELTNNRYGVFRVYVSKDDIESATPTYYSVMHTEQFVTLTLARNAITDGVAEATNELAEIELAQLGYIIVRNNASDGYIVEVTIEKSTAGGNTTGSGATNVASLVSVDTTNFDGNLSSLDSNVQTALETIDDLPGISQSVKAWVRFSGAATVVTIDDSFNVTSVTRNSVGNYTITWDTNYATANYAIGHMVRGADSNRFAGIIAQAAGTLQIEIWDADNTVTEAEIVAVMTTGDQ